jgi:hypothetical protein
VRAEVVDDVALGRRSKAAGQRLRPVVSTSLLEVRMYRDGAAMREGFAKNLYALAGGRPLPYLVAVLVFLLTAVYPWAGAALGARGAGLPLGLLLGVRACGAAVFRHGPRSILLHPVGSLLLAWLALESCSGSRRGALRWKGRRIHAACEAAPAEARPTARSSGTPVH